MLYNFAVFVEWPRGTLEGERSPLVVGVLGEDPFGEILDEMVRGEVVQGHPIEVRRFPRLTDLSICHLLFVSESMQPHLPQIFRVVERMGVLTVGDSDRFPAEGGIIGFIREGKKVRFEINVAVAEREGFRISSKLLRLARIRGT